MLLVRLHELSTLMAVVIFVWGSIGVPALGDNQDVGCTAERIGVDGDGSEVDVRVVTRGLAGRGTVEIPLGEIFNLEGTAFWNLGEGLKAQIVRCVLKMTRSGARSGISPLTWYEHHHLHQSRCTFRKLVQRSGKSNPK